MNKKRKLILSSGIAIVIIGYFYVDYRIFGYYDGCGSSVIKKIDSYMQVVDMLDHVDTNTLVLFDIDETLVVSSGYIQWIKRIIDEIFTPNQKLEDHKKSKAQITEPIVATIIKSLQNRNIEVLALTLANIGSGQHVPFYPEVRSKILQEVGIDFSRTNIPDTISTHMAENNETHPLLYKGILFTNHEAKGLALGAFLEYMHWKPSKVIFFDNSLKHVKNVAQETCTRGIPFIGYHYVGSEYLPS